MNRSEIVTDRTHLARIQVLLGALIISFSSIFVKLAHVGPTTAGFYRMLFGSIALLTVVLIKRHRLWVGWRAAATAGTAGMMFFLGLVFWHHSIHFIGPGLATIFANHQVFVVAFGAILFMGERPSRRLVLAIPLAVVGLFLIVFPDWPRVGPDYKNGIYLGLTAAVWYGSFLIIMRRSGGFRPALSPVANITVASIFSTIFMALEVFRRNEGFVIPDGPTWSALLTLGVGCHAVGWWLIINGMPKIPLSAVGLSILLQPTGAFIWEMMFFGRTTSIIETAGAALALGAIYLGSTSRRADTSQSSQSHSDDGIEKPMPQLEG